MNIFNFIKEISVNKTKWEDLPDELKKLWNSYIILKALSMYEPYTSLINEIQIKNTLSNSQQYTLLCNLLPKKSFFSPWPKNKKDDISSIEIISKYFNISFIKAKNKIDVYSPDDIELMKIELGINDNNTKIKKCKKNKK